MTSAPRVPDFGTACAPHRYRVFLTSIPRVPHIGTVCSRLRYRVCLTSVPRVPDFGHDIGSYARVAESVRFRGMLTSAHM
ncbi:unnamed protein product [Arabis nemorensis]|uniref:Uncharacterized protein n=1 Tax=Arabis nemorensis TaxID=586526 RepID=A0A565C5U8_9BRAS|nr:unnamed protein product [Arabis nemorensis]